MRNPYQFTEVEELRPIKDVEDVEQDVARQFVSAAGFTLAVGVIVMGLVALVISWLAVGVGLAGLVVVVGRS